MQKFDGKFGEDFFFQASVLFDCRFYAGVFIDVDDSRTDEVCLFFCAEPLPDELVCLWAVVRLDPLLAPHSVWDQQPLEEPDDDPIAEKRHGEDET